MKTMYWFFLLAGLVCVQPSLQAALVGSWQFNDPENPLKSTVGSDAVVAKGHGSSVVQEGLGEVTVVDGLYEGDKAVVIPYETHLRMMHGVPTDSTRPWTLVMRFYIPEDAPATHTFFTTRSQDNSQDADLFLNGSKQIGGGLFSSQSGNYSTAVSFGAWHTLVVRSDMNYQDAWLDGTRVLYAVRTLSGQRSDLKDRPLLLISADNDNEDNIMHVSSVEVYDEIIDETYIKNYPGGKMIGWWEFNPENPTKATIGQDLVTATNNGTGAGSIPAEGNFKAVGGISSADGAQQVARYSHYRLTHGLPAETVPTYTMMMDIRSPAASMNQYRALIQTTIANNDDGDLFIRSSDNAIGVQDAKAWGGYTSFGCQADTWYRVTIVCDQNKRTLWVDGVQRRSSTTTLESSYYNLQNRPEIILFGDNSGEDYPLDVSNVMLFDYPMTDAEVKAYGTIPTGSSPDSLPSDLPRGEWDMAAGISDGKIASLLGESLTVAGEAAATIESRPGPDGTPDGALFFPRYSWLTWSRPGDPSGLKLNNHAYIFDLRIPADQNSWVALYQCDPSNSNDGDCFIYPSASGQGADRRGSIGLSSTPGFTCRRVTLGEWMRVTISASLGNTYSVYVNGEYWGQTGNLPGANSSFTPGQVMHFLCDNNGEHLGVECSYIAAYDRALAPWEAAALGNVRIIDSSNELPVITDSSVPQNAVVGTGDTFSVTFTDLESDAAVVCFDFGNGATLQTGYIVPGSSGSVTYTYPYPGVFTVKATLRDPQGRTTGWSELGTVTVTGSTENIRLLTPPYQQNFTQTEATIMFETDQTYPLTLSANGQILPLTITASTAGTYINKVRITGLTAGQTIAYEVLAGTTPVTNTQGTLTTNPPDGANPDFTLSVWGDSQSDTASGDWNADRMLAPRRMFQDMVNRQLNFGICTGDAAGTPSNYSGGVRPYYLDTTCKIVGKAMPFYIAWGNHDCYSGSLTLRQFAEQPSLFEENAGYDPSYGNFHFYYGDCLFVFVEWGLTGAGSTSTSASPLDSRDYNSPETQAWMADILSSPKAQQARFRFVFVHAPPFCELWSQDTYLRAWLNPLLNQHNVDFCFSGHTHEYERAKSGNVNYIVSGCMSYLDHGETLTANNAETIVGGKIDVPGLWARQSSNGVLGPAQPIKKGLFQGYGTLSVSGSTVVYEMHGFNADGSYIGVMDSVTVTK